MIKIPKPYIDAEAEHSEYSPSGSKRWINCPASIKMIREIERDSQAEPKENFYAEEGTAAHELSAYCLDNQCDAESMIHDVFNNFIIDREMARQTQKYIDYVNNQVTWDSTLWVENRLSLEFIQENMFGTADAIVVSEDSLEIIDLKYGRGNIVEVEDNPQLMLYAIGVLAHLKKHGFAYPDGFDVKMTIVQPRAPHMNGPIRSDYKTVAQLRDFKEIVIDAIEKSMDDEPSFGPGEEQCKWCPVAPICKPYAEYNLNVAQLEFAEFEKSANEFKNGLSAINSLSKDQIANILTHSKALEQWLKSITEYAIDQMKSGQSIRGYKLVYGRSNRAWENQDRALQTLLEYGTDEDRLFTKKFLSPAQAEKELTKEEFELINDMIFKPTGNLTIAKETDGRPAVDFTAEAKRDWIEEEI